nr:DUF2637 domain-containing protein [Herbidospora sp. NBRC 101105]
MSRVARWLLDSGPVVVLALIAGAGSFSHIRRTALENGQTGWMAWAIAICIDLTCVMAARERQRDKRTGRTATGRVSWPVVVMTGGITLSLAANLHQAYPTVWGWLTAATPAVAFLIAVSMLERRASGTAAPAPGPSTALVAYAQRLADDHRAKHGEAISPTTLQARLGVSAQLATDLFRTLKGTR